jgi:hypothetical protein
MLEEVIDCWRKYNACVDVLTVWLNDGERVMSRSAEEKQVSFVGSSHPQTRRFLYMTRLYYTNLTALLEVNYRKDLTLSNILDINLFLHWKNFCVSEYAIFQNNKIYALL